jgi:adenosylcobinamide-phosphate synthase
VIAPPLLLGAFLLDLLIGDPRWIPHPVVVIGHVILRTESLLRRLFQPSKERIAGVILAAVVVLLAAFVAMVLSRLLLSVSHGFLMALATLLFVYLASTTLALRSLVSAARDVLRALDHGDISGARNKLAMIVGRDTENLAEESIVRATIETIAENLSDGFIAPLFYLSVGGLPLALAYKAVNTLDSMVGYKNDRYLRLGWASARLDDVANYIPARLTGAAIVISAFLFYLPNGFKAGWQRAAQSLTTMRRDGRNHTSPNSGISEAAMAGALGIRLGGASSYGGVVVEKPYIGEERNADYRYAANAGLTITVVAACLAVALALAFLISLRGLV